MSMVRSETPRACLCRAQRARPWLQGTMVAQVVRAKSRHDELSV
jgi:hypothetical protein